MEIGGGITFVGRISLSLPPTSVSERTKVLQFCRHEQPKKPNTQKKVNWHSVHVTESKIEVLQFSIQYEGSYVDTFVSNNKLLWHS